MPRRDQTGPLGNGPMTGHQSGKCVGANSYASRGQRLRGNRNRNEFNQTVSLNTNKESLHQEKSFLESRLEEINHALKES